MQQSASNSDGVGKTPVKLNRIVTPAYMKISALPAQGEAVELLDDVIDLPPPEKAPADPAMSKMVDADELPFFLQEPIGPMAPVLDIARPAPEPEETPEHDGIIATSSLKKMGLTAAVLTVSIVAMLFLWGHDAQMGKTTVASNVASTEPEVTVQITKSLPGPDPAIAHSALFAAQSPLKIEEITVLAARISLDLPAPGPISAAVSSAPVLIQRPRLISPRRMDQHSIMQATALPFVSHAPAPLTPKPEAPAPQPVAVELANPTTDIIQQLTQSTVAALRREQPSEMSLSLFEFVRNARVSGRTDTAIDVLINAAHQGRTLKIPQEFILANGLVDTRAIFAAMSQAN